MGLHYVALLLSITQISAEGLWYRNVREYGAVGDGVADDTAAFHAALTDNRTDIRSTKQQLYLEIPAGDYKVTASLRMYFYTTMQGATGTDGSPLSRIFLDANVAPSSQVYLVEGPLSCDNCQHTDDFYYQVKDLVLDVSAPGNAQAVAVHWAVSQATMLRNVRIVATGAAAGIFTENGSGGVMRDVTIIGGSVGATFGSQQWTFVNVTVSDSVNAGFNLLWNWEMAFLHCTFTNLPIAFKVPSTVLGLVIRDTHFADVGIVFHETFVAPNRTFVVQNSTFSGTPRLLSCTGTEACTQPDVMVPASGKTDNFVIGLTLNKTSDTFEWTSGEAVFKSEVLEIDPFTHVNVAALQKKDFYNVANSGAKGDCSASDSGAIQNAIDRYQNVYLPSGCYLLTEGITLKADTRLFGSGLSELRSALTSGTAVSTGNNETGVAQLYDLIITTHADCATCLLLSWGAGMGSALDVHFRVTHTIDTIMHVTRSGGGYIENMWGWVADHDIDTDVPVLVKSKQGALLQGQSQMSLVGTAFEHSELFQYKVYEANVLSLVMPQTETAYWLDPPTGAGFVAVNSSVINLICGGFYNWFNGIQSHVIEVNASDVLLVLPSVNAPNANKTNGVNAVVKVNGESYGYPSPPFNDDAFCTQFALMETIL